MISLLILLFSIKLNFHLVIENLAMRQQLAIIKQSIKQHKVTSAPSGPSMIKKIYKKAK